MGLCVLWDACIYKMDAHAVKLSLFVYLSILLLLTTPSAMAGTWTNPDTNEGDYFCVTGGQKLYGTCGGDPVGLCTQVFESYGSSHPVNYSGYSFGVNTSDFSAQMTAYCMYGYGAPQWHYSNIITRYSCAVGMSFDDNSGECASPPTPCEQDVNPVTGFCEECSSGQYTPEGNCMPGFCGADQMMVRDPTTSCIDSSGSACSTGWISDCIDPPEDGCSDIIAKKDSDYFPETFNFCQSMKDACTEIGGTYGAIGTIHSASHVCVKNGSDGPTCASGSSYWIKDDPSADTIEANAFSCISTTPPNDVCDGSKYDCDGDGKIDDQDGDGCVDNGGLNDFVSCSGIDPVTGNETGDGEGGAGPSDPNDPWTGENIGEDTPGSKGTGACDPTAKDYAECSGFNGGLSKGDSDNLKDTAITLGEIKGLFEGKSGGTGSGLYDEQSVQQSFEGLYSGLSAVPVFAAASNFGASLSGAGACPVPTFDAFGSTYSINMHCTIYDSIAGILSAVMLLVWSVAGIRHIMSA